MSKPKFYNSLENKEILAKGKERFLGKGVV
jgi:hypothetical protein